MFARTRRLTLRPAWPEDAPALAAAISDERVVTMLSRVPWPYRLSDAEAFIARQPIPGELRCMIVAHEAVGPALIGGIGLHLRGERPGSGSHELGYWLTPSAWGRGYATEAGHAVVDMARHAMGLRRLNACHAVDNPGSGAVLRKLGFRPTGATAPLPSLARGGEVESVLYELDLVGKPAVLLAA